MELAAVGDCSLEWSVPIKHASKRREGRKKERKKERSVSFPFFPHF
jgi:hypothetical protein